MKLAIHQSDIGFHPRWRYYCEQQGIPYKTVNCYANDIIDQLVDCDALLWHYSHSIPKDLLIAKQILFALEHTGFKVFPDFHTAWHFDDKVAQKYLLERIGAPLVPSYVFVNRKEALEWAFKADYPKVFKLRGGAGSANVRLVPNRKKAKQLIRQAFGKGFANYDAMGSLTERWRKFRMRHASAWEVLKGFMRLAYPPFYARTLGRERGYVYFQDFISGNDSDTRIIVIGDMAFGLKRYVRDNDFRASGSGNFAFAREEFDERCVQIAFELNKKIHSQSIAYDFVFDEANSPLIIEISYGFTPEGYNSCPGYWDTDLIWHEGEFDPYGWMVEEVIPKSTDGW